VAPHAAHKIKFIGKASKFMEIPEMDALGRVIQKFMAQSHFGKFLIKARIPAASALPLAAPESGLVVYPETEAGRADNRAFAAFNASLPQLVPDLLIMLIL